MCIHIHALNTICHYNILSYCTLHVIIITVFIIITVVGRPDQGSDDGGRGRQTDSGCCTQTPLGMYTILYIVCMYI